jgi:HEAT repeat protein/energy-coupling factor transporter ATP-binding protein EcfA2
MQKPMHRNTDELLDAYRDYLLSKVSKVHILGEADERELKEVFVELSVVDQPYLSQQHAKFLGMVDSVMRRRFNPFADADEDVSQEQLEQRRMKPDDLLRRRTKAIITGTPGCGKTTLLKYLALQAQEKEKRLAVWLELKEITKPLFDQAEIDAAQSGYLTLTELWLKHLKIKLRRLSDEEIKLLRAYWQERFNANEVMVLLDGFDELRDETIERSLAICIEDFASAAHGNVLLISTRPYAQDKLGKGQLRELEIEPLNQHQIEAFLNCYYPNDDATKSLLNILCERPSLRELLHVPLLLGIILSLHREGRFADGRRELYKTIIEYFVEKPSKEVNRLFKINDKRLRLDFLKFLAFERLLHDRLDEEEQEANRIVFNYDLLKEKARKFLKEERPSHNPRDLADDVLATPLLREVGSDAFAFTHLTLQEYLAACAFATFYQKKGNKAEGQKIFCRAYHNPMIVEMELLPMMLGEMTDADSLYAEIECWPESLNFTNLRLRARGLAYSAKIKQGRLSDLVDRLFEFILEKNQDEQPYRKIIINSFAGANSQAIGLIESKAAASNIPSIADLVSMSAALVRIGSEKAADVLIATLDSGSANTDSTAIKALAQTGSRKAVDALIEVLNNNENNARWEAADMLDQIGSETAVDALTSVLEDETHDVRWRAAAALVRIGSEKAADVLTSALKQGDVRTRRSAAKALGRGSPEQAIDALISALNDEDSEVRWLAALALGDIGSEKAIDALILALNDEDSEVRWRAASVLGKFASERATDALISALNDEDNDARWSVATALGEIGSDEAVDVLISALNDKDSFVRSRAADALGKIGSRRATDVLISELKREDKNARLNAAYGLGQIGSEEAVDVLLSALNDDEDDPRGMTAQWYEGDNEGQNATYELAPLGSELIADILNVVFDDETDLSYLERGNRIPMAEGHYIREDAFYALGRIGSEKAIDVLIPALNDKDIGVRSIAADALGRIGSERAVGSLIAALKEYGSLNSHAARALAQMEIEPLTRGLTLTLKYPDIFARKKAISVIGYYSNDKQTLNQLKQLARKDKSGEVRAAARQAAEKFTRKLELLEHFIQAGAAQTLTDSSSKEDVLVYEVGLIVSTAGHIFREVLKHDEGIDGEIEFRNEEGRGSGQRVYLQLKSGDSYLIRQKSGKEIFRIKKPRHAQYWIAHNYPVLLVIRNADGRIRWMNVTEYIQRHRTNIRHIEFQGEPFTAESVNQMHARFVR